MARTKQTVTATPTPAPVVQVQEPTPTLTTTPSLTAPEEVKSKRTFKIVLDSIKPRIEDTSKLPKNGGRYTGSTPMQSAKKAFTQIHRRCTNKDEECTFSFSIQETSSGEEGRVFSYTGRKLKRDVPLEIKKGESKYNINYSTEVKALGKKNEVTVVEKPQPVVMEMPKPQLKTVEQPVTQVANSLTAKRPRTKSVKA
jgi:hypothetical protein